MEPIDVDHIDSNPEGEEENSDQT